MKTLCSKYNEAERWITLILYTRTLKYSLVPPLHSLTPAFPLTACLLTHYVLDKHSNILRPEALIGAYIQSLGGLTSCGLGG